MVTVKPCHLSPLVAAAVGGGICTHMPMVTDWPNPAGFGATLQYAHVVMFHAGVCALAMPKYPSEDAKIAMMRAANNLFFVFFTFFPPD